MSEGLPRLYCIVATAAPVALVFLRRPSSWFHLLQWDLNDGSLQSGVWVRKKLYPRRCDLSADGRLLCFYLAGGFPPPSAACDDLDLSQGSAEYRVHGGISRVPWLRPLALWEEPDTWGRGWHFVDKPAPERRGCYLSGRQILVARNEADAFANERRRGWSEALDCPARSPDDIWDEKRSVVLEKPRPVGQERLRLIGGLYTTEKAIDGRAPRFELRGTSGVLATLSEAMWADWDHQGRLLVASSTGQLRIHEVETDSLRTIVEHDLRPLVPDPRPAPDWAGRE